MLCFSYPLFSPRIRFPGAIPLAALLLTGCAVGPDFERPVTQADAYTAKPPPAKTASAPVAAGAAQSFARNQELPANWWTLFQSPGLNALMRQALAANPDLEAAKAALRQAQEIAQSQRGALFPALDVNFSPARQKISPAAFGTPNGKNTIFTLYNASASVSYGIDIFGGARRLLEAALANADYQRFEMEAAYLSLTANIVTAAAREAALREQIQATRHIIDIESRQRDVLKSQFELGGASKAALLLQQAVLAQTRATLPELEKQLSQTRTQLAALAGRMPGEPLEASFDLASLHLPETLPLSLPSALTAQRPDIRAAEALLHAASAQIGVATAKMLPRLTLSASYGTESVSFGTLFTPATEVWAVGANVLQPVFHGGQLLHERRAAVAAYDEARARYRSVVLQAFRDVADTLRALEYDAESLSAQADAEATAKASLNMAQDQFKLGAINYPQLLDAQRIYAQTHINLAQAQAARISDTAALFQALGGGWWRRAGNETPEAARGAASNSMEKPAGTISNNSVKSAAVPFRSPARPAPTLSRAEPKQ